MRIIKVEKFTATSGNDILLELCDNKMGSTVVGEIYLQTTTALPFTVKGTVDGTNYELIKVFDMAAMQATSSVTTKGIFMLNAAGYKSIIIVPTGSGDITVKETY